MENLKFNLDSVEVSYGDNALTTVIQIDERISSIANYLHTHNEFNDFEKTEIIDRLNKLIELNHKIQQELEVQVQKINDIKPLLAHEPMNEPLRIASVL
jgi:ligand-binding SRPBCC domain-containing protein